jgi:hypothetical protein
MNGPEGRLADLNRHIRSQWAKYDRAVEAGLTGAPLAQINAKLVRLENERDNLEAALSREESS